jgi:Family of unknown function (DUF5906)
MSTTACRADFAGSWNFCRRFHPGRLLVVTAIFFNKRKDGAKTATRTFTPDQRDEFIQWCAAAATEANLYFSIGEPVGPLTEKAARTEIKAVHWLHGELDAKPIGKTDATTDEIAAHLDAERSRLLALASNPPGGLPPPTIVVWSGGGVWCYWQLDQPIVIDGDLAKAEDAALYNVGIIRAFGGSEADHCQDVSRIARLPFSVNTPDAKKRKKGRIEALAEVISDHPDRIYSIEQFTKAAKSAPKPSTGGSGQPVKVVAPAAVRQFLSVDDLGAGVSDSVKVCIVNGENPDDPGHFPSRSEMLFWVCCELVRAGVDDETIYAVLMNRDWKISDSILEKGGGAERYALRQIERAKEDAVDPMLRELNDRHAVIGSVNGKCRVIEEVECPTLKRPTLVFSTFEDFRNRYLNRSVTVGQKTLKNGQTIDQEMPAGEWWLRHAQRRQYRTIALAPSGCADDIYNLWRGWSCDPRPGDWSLLKQHLFLNVCGGSLTHHLYLLRWMANAVQNPAEPGHVAVVMRGGKGTGKGIVAKHFGSLWGRHYRHVSNPEHVTGRFNDHLRDTIVLFCDEAFFAGDKKHESVLKTLITEPTLSIEKKGVDMGDAPNFLHVIVASNSRWVVPATKDERRFFVIDVADSNMQDTAYFGAIQRQMDSGGREAMLHDLLTMDLSGFEVRNVPKTGALGDQVREGLSGIESLWFELLCRGEIPFGVPGDDGTMLVSATALIDWARDQRRPDWARINFNTISALLGEPQANHATKRNVAKRRTWMGFEKYRVTHGPLEGQRVYRVPPLPECRERWCRFQFEHPWDDPSEHWSRAEVPSPTARRQASVPYGGSEIGGAQ